MAAYASCRRPAPPAKAHAMPVRAQTPAVGPSPDSEAGIAFASSLRTDFAHVPVRTSNADPGSCHPAPLRIGRPHEAAEREADRAAERVMRGERVQIAAAPVSSLRRKCDGCEYEEGTDGASLPGETVAAERAAPAVAAALGTSGRPLDPATRAYFEPRFGTSFAGVRVHADAAAANVAGSIGAHAFTLGSRIGFATGAYAPETRPGQRLLAHELAHVAQDRQTADSPFEADPAVLRRQSVDFDLEVATPEDRERQRALGIELPTAAADPRTHSDYVDRRLQAVGFSIYLGGYYLYVTGMDVPIFVRDSMFDFSATATPSRDPALYPDYQTALAHVPAGPPAQGESRPVTYYRGAGGSVIAPTLFTRSTAPNVIETALEARRQLAAYVQEQLVVLAIGLVGGMLIRGVIGLVSRVGGGRGRAPPSPQLGQPASLARQFARQSRQRGQPVIANMGGAGAPHEPAGAVNINNQVVARRGIPNLVETDASNIGQLFDPGTVDQVVGFRMAPGVIDWQRAVPGINSVLRSQGRFSFEWRWPNPETGQVAALLRAANFRNVHTEADMIVTATRP